MKKIIYLVICLFVGAFTPPWGSGGLLAQVSNGIQVTNFSVTGNTITFTLAWEKAELNALGIPWSDSVWVFVDYQTATRHMERLSLEGAAITQDNEYGNTWMVDDNTQGFYLKGVARAAGAFLTNVTITPSFNGNLATSGVCVYASNYPPFFKFNTSWTSGTFTGTPKFVGMISNGSETRLVTFSEEYTFPAGYTLHSFTDATGQPGIMSCKPLGGTLDFNWTPTLVRRDVEVTFSVSDAPSPSDVTYSWDAPDFITQTGSGDNFTTTAPDTPGNYPVTLTARKTGYCDLSVTKSVEVQDCEAAVITLSSAAATQSQTVCQGVAITNIQFTLSGSASSCTVAGLPAGMTAGLSGKVITISGAPSAAGVFEYAVTTSGHQAPCSAVTATGTITVNAKPTISLSGSSTVIRGNTITFTGSPSGGAFSSNNTSIASVNSSSGVVTGVADGTATITYSATSNGCPGSATKSVTVSVDGVTGYCGVTIAKADAGTSTWQPNNLCPSGWRWPSLSELQCMYTNRNSIGGFVSNYYWSSQGYSTGHANCVGFSNGKTYNDSKTFSYRVRCVR